MDLEEPLVIEGLPALADDLVNPYPSTLHDRGVVELHDVADAVLRLFLKLLGLCKDIPCFSVLGNCPLPCVALEKKEVVVLSDLWKVKFGQLLPHLWRHSCLDQIPKLPAPRDDCRDEIIVPVHIEVDQFPEFGIEDGKRPPLPARYGKIMLKLDEVVVRNALPFDLQEDLHTRTLDLEHSGVSTGNAHNETVDVAQHPRMVRVLENLIHPADLPAGRFRILPRDEILKGLPSLHRR